MKASHAAALQARSMEQLAERMAQIEARVAQPIEVAELAIAESEPLATAAQLASAQAALSDVCVVVTGLSGFVNALAERLDRIESKLDAALAQRQPQQHPQRSK
jgi:hypothetical protein